MTYIPNPDFSKRLVAEDEYIAGMEKCARDIRDRAHSIKHRVMPNKDHSPVEVDVDDDTVYVINTDFGGHIDEYGSANNPAYAPMRTAVMAAGFRLEEEQK